MSHRARGKKATTTSSPTSPAKTKKKPTRNSIQKKSPMKRNLDQTCSSSLTQPRQKRLSSLTAATLLQYCTSILTPSRKLKANSQKKPSSIEEKPANSRKRKLSNHSDEQDKSNIPTRTRREASSRASAMIMQQNEIERSRYNYSLVKQPTTTTTTTLRRHPTKSTITNKDDTPVVPPLITNISAQIECAQPSTTVKYPLLTEAILAEHNRLQESITAKQDNLLKWTQELALCGRLSPPYPPDDIPPEKPIHSDIKEIPISTISDPVPVNITRHSSEHLSSAPTFLFPSSTYPLDLRSFYPILPCWQYPSWPYPISSSSKHHRTSVEPKKTSIIPIQKQTKEPLTFHLHTHHHHHIHNNSNSSSLSKSLNPTKTTAIISLSSEKELHSTGNDTNQTIIPINIQNDNQALNLSTNSKKTTRRKSSPVKRCISNRTKSASSPVPSTSEQVPQIDPPSVSNLRLNSPIRRPSKRRTVSATVTTTVSITGRNSNRNRTSSASNRKRLHSPSSITLPLSSNKNLNQRKKQKKLHYWVLFGKSEQKRVAIHADKPPVFRECYSSIQHITEKDIIKSNDCIILRSESGTRSPYVAKVRCFWEEPTTGEIQMSVLWYYHPEHTELPLHIKENFLPNELLASRYWDCLSVECIEDKCYVLNLNEYNRYCLREKSIDLFEHSESVGQLKVLLNKNIPTIQHRSLPSKTVANQNVFFSRYVYDYRVHRILKNPTFVSTASTM